MTQISYTARKKEEKWVLTRYTFKNNNLEERFWVNTFYTKEDLENYMKIIKDFIESHKYELTKETKGKEIWEINYKCQ